MDASISSQLRERCVTAHKLHGRTVCIIVLALAANSLALYSGQAAAQTRSQYCYKENCSQTLEQAEQAMRSSSVYGPYLRKDRTEPYNVSASIPQMRIRYTVGNQAPVVMYPFSYMIAGWGYETHPGFCARSEDPNLPGLCRDESEIIANLQAYFEQAYPQCTYTNLHISGVYGEPFVHSREYYGHGYLAFDTPEGRYFNHEVKCPGWDSPSPREFQLIKAQTYECPVGFTPIWGYNPPYNTTGNPDYVAHWPELCRPTSDHEYIYATVIEQTRSCPANANPCYPATGDKARVENDLVFAGRAFNRYYHSLTQIQADSSMAIGWSHSYSDYVGLDGGPYLITADGYFEKFKQVKYRVYRGLKLSGVLLKQNSDGTWALITQAGELRRYDSRGRLVSVASAQGAAFDVELTYDEDRLIFVADRRGRRLRFIYENDLLSRVELDDGSGVTYAYDEYRNLISADYGSARKGYHYHENGLALPSQIHALTGISHGDSRYATFAYNADGAAISSTLHTSHGQVETTTLQYLDGTHVLVNTPDGATRQYEVGGGLYRDVRGIASASGSETFVYDTDARLVSHTDRLETTRSLSYEDSLYDDDFSSVTVVDAVGTPDERTSITTRDASNRIIRVERYSGSGSSKLATAAESFVYNDLGLLRFACDVDVMSSAADSYACGTANDAPEGVHQTRFTYCEQADVDLGTCPLLGLVTAVDGPRTDVADLTTYTYYPGDHSSCATTPTTCPYRKGDLWKVTNALGHVTETLRYDDAGRALSVKDPNGVVTDFEYHPRGWLTARKVRGSDSGTETDDAITRIEYAPTGLVTKVTQPDGAFTVYEYDAAHRLVTIEDNYGNRIAYTLDNAGNRTREDTFDNNGALLRTLSRVYNQVGRLQTAKDAYDQVTGYTYDAAGNTDIVTDALGRVTDNDYDPLGRLTRSLQDVAGIAAETTFAYDALDNLTQVTDPKGLSTHYQYNAYNDLTQLDSPDTGVTTYTYDSAGNRVSATDARGKLTVYTYDALNRLTGIGYDDASLNVSYIYDVAPGVCAAGETFAIGRLSKMLDGSGSTEYCYDRHGQLVRKMQNTAGHSFSVRYTYTPGGRLQSITYPSGLRVDYTHNALGQTTAVQVAPQGGSTQTLLSSVTWYPFGPAAELIYGDGRSLKRSLDQNYRPGFIEDTAPGGLSVGYQFDAVGNLVTLRHGDQSEPPLRTYGYDALNRLNEVKDGVTDALLQGYTYDATGNRTSATVHGATLAYSYPADSHRLASIAGQVRSYDATGNTAAIGATRQFTYNAAGRMSQVQHSGVPAMHYAYNGKGEQVRRYPGEASPSQTYAVYDQGGRVLGTYDVAGQHLQEVIWLGDLPVGVLVGEQLLYVEADHLGTPRTVIDPARQVAVWEWPLTGETFGDTPPTQDPDGNGVAFTLDLRLPGQQFDAVSGLVYNVHRNYEAETGRYTRPDPIGLNGGVSMYSYANASPLKNIDPNGLMWFGPTCDAAQRASITSQVIQLANEISWKASKANNQCEEGNCDFELAADVMRWIAHQAYFSCDRSGPCAEVAGPYVYLYPPYIGAPDSSQISSPRTCGCFRSALFHEAAHAVRLSESEDDIRRETLSCVSCGTNISELGGPL